jgi:hypothetical protein
MRNRKLKKNALLPNKVINVIVVLCSHNFVQCYVARLSGI